MNKLYNEAPLGRTRDREILIGTLIGAAAAMFAVWFITALVFSLA